LQTGVKSVNATLADTDSDEYMLVKQIAESTVLKKIDFHKDKTITEPVYDESGNRIGDNTTITQENVDAIINKLYVCGDFSFIQFIPSAATVIIEGQAIQTEQRKEGILSYGIAPDGISCGYGEDGIPFFDKSSYLTDKTHASFIIYNPTGKIYSLKDIQIREIKNDVIIGQNNYLYNYYMEGDNLKVKSVLSNTDILIWDKFRDKFGNVYIQTEQDLSGDSTENIIFFTKENKKYYYTDKHIAVKYENRTYSKVSGYGFQTSPIDKNDSFVIENLFPDSENQVYYKNMCYIEHGKALCYLTNAYGLSFCRDDVSKINGDVQPFQVEIFDNYSKCNPKFLFYKNILILSYAKNFSWDMTDLYYYVFDFNNIDIKNNENNLNINLSECIPLMQNVKLMFYWADIFRNYYIIKSTAAGTINYGFKFNENAVDLVEKSSTVAEKVEIVLQPLN